VYSQVTGLVSDGGAAGASSHGLGTYGSVWAAAGGGAEKLEMSTAASTAANRRKRVRVIGVACGSPGRLRSGSIVRIGRGSVGDERLSLL
jgi:hypothetical protein